jgi:hypothetical protein
MQLLPPLVGASVVIGRPCLVIGRAPIALEAHLRAVHDHHLEPDRGDRPISGGRKGAFYLRLPLGPVATNERSSRRATNRPWESSHVWRRTSSILRPTR